MIEIKNPEFTQHFIVYGPDGTRHTGVVGPNQVLSSGQPNIITDADPNNFIKSASDAGLTDFNPLPEVGSNDELIAGDIYSYSGSLVIVRQTHTRTIYEPQETPALFTTYRENPENADWIPNESVIAGDVRIFNAEEYRCLQSHTTQEGWEPNVTPALWKKISSQNGIQEWTQPTGAHDAYSLNDEVTHNGSTWRSLYDANVWEPGVFGWIEI